MITPSIHLACTQADFDIAACLIQQYAHSLPFSLEFQGLTDELAHLGEIYGPPRGQLLLATLGDRPVGCVGIRPLGEHICEMKRLFVQAPARGQGIGRQLALASLQAAARLGYRQMRLDTVRWIAAANRLYASLGFEPIDPYNDNPQADAMYFERRL